MHTGKWSNMKNGKILSCRVNNAGLSAIMAHMNQHSAKLAEHLKTLEFIGKGWRLTAEILCQILTLLPLVTCVYLYETEFPLSEVCGLLSELLGIKRMVDIYVDSK